MAKKFKPTTASKINESVDISVKENVRSKIINYAQQRLNKSGAVLLAPVYDIINFNDPLDGMISFDYLNTIAENEELSEESSGYDYIEQAVTDIANFIQNQGFIMDEDSDDPLIFIDENYDEELEDMNEAASIKKSDRYREFDLLPKGKGWMDPIELTNRDAGFYAIAGTAYDSTDRNNEDEWGIVVSLTPLDSKYEDILITGSFYDYEEAADSIMNRLSRAKTPMDVARIIKNQKFSDEWGDDESEFLSALTKSFSAQNESTNVMNESVRVSKPKSKEALSHYLTSKGSTMISNDKLGYYVILGKQSDEDGNPDEEGIPTAYISILGTSSKSIDNKKINEVLESTFEDSSKARSMIKEISQVEDLDQLSKVLRKYEFYNSDIDTTSGQRGFISLLEGKLDSVNESTMINEATKIKSGDPELEYFGLLDSNNPFDFEPVFIDNPTLGFSAIAGVATGSDPDADFDEDDCSIEVIVYTDNEDASQDTLVAEYYDVDYKAMQVMNELAKATQFKDLTNILVKEGFTGATDGPFDFVKSLEAANSMNEATEVPDGRMTVELDDTDVVEGDTLLLAELTDDVFNAVNAVLDELDPDADVEITIDNEDLLQLAVVSDEDLDDDAFDQVLSELLEDMDLEDIVADMTDSEPIEDPEDEDFGRVIQYINFYPSTGATVVPDNSVMDDNIDVIEDEDVINESTAPDYSSLANKVKDCIATYYSEGVVQRASVEVNKNKDSVVCVDLKFPNRDGIDAKQAKEISKLVLSKFDNLRTLSNKKEAVPQFNTRIDIKGDCLVYYVMPYNNARPGEAILARYNFVVTNSSMNESFKLNTDLTKFVDKLADSFFGSIKDANFLNLEDEDGNLYFQVSTGDKSYSRKLLTNFLAFLAKKNVDFDLVNKVNVTGNSTFWNATVTVKINNKQGSQVQYRNELNESVDPIYESYYKDTDEDLSIDQAKITKALKAISRILTKEGYPLDNLDKVYRFNYPRPGLVEINLINTLKSTYGRISDKAYDIDSKIEKKLESLNLTYASKDKYGKEIYTDEDKLVHYDGKDISKYIQTGKVPDREFRNNRVDAVQPKLEDIAKGITEYLTSHPTYKKYNTYGYEPVHVGADYISIKVEVANVEYGKEILSDTDKYIKKNYKDLYPIIRSNPPDKKYPYIHYSLFDTGRPLGHLMKSEYEMRGSSIKKLMNESANYKKFSDKLETYLNDDIDTIYDEMVVSVDETDYGYNINVTFDNRLLGSNPSKIISKIVDHIVERNGKYSDLVHYNNKVTGDYKLVFYYKGQLNECAIIGPDETDIDTLRANELSRALSSEQPLVDPYDIRCTIRPVFVRKDQFLFDGSTVYKATANASTDKDSGTTEIKVDVLLSNDPDISDASMTLTLPTEFDGLKLLRGNPTKVYNESADVKVDTVTLSFANEDEANEFIKDNGVKPEKSFEGKFGWTVILKKSDLKKVK